MMMTFQPLRHAALLCLTLAVAACASNPPSAEKPVEAAAPAEKAAPAQQAPGVGHRAPSESAGPQEAPTPGGYWPPKPIEESNEPPKPLPKLPSTDELKLDAERNPKAELKQRSLERWLYLINKRGEIAYEYLTPGYQKTHDKTKYARDMADRPVQWFRATFDSVDCATEASCEVRLLVDFRVRMTAGMGVTTSFSYVKERWIAADGVWYHLPSETGG